MEWETVQHLDLRHAGGRRGAGAPARPLQPHAAAFRASQAIVAVAVGTHVVEFDALTGSKIALVDLGARVVRMAYSPTSSHVIIAILEDATIRSCDFATEQTLVLHSPEKKTDHVSIDTEVHLALTPLEPIVFFGFHKRMSVTVVGTVEGGRPPTKIKTDLKKPIVNLACHPRLPVFYVAYAEGLVRAYNVQTYAVHYTLQLPVDSTIKLMGAGAFGFHPTLEWVFIGDRGGTLLAWDVSTERPNMIGITQAGSQPITSVSWLPTLKLLVTISKDGGLQVWKTRVIINNNRQPMETHFFERAAIETMDITKILTLQGGEAVYPLPRIKNLAVHPKFNLAAVIFQDMSATEAAKNKAAYTREGRRQLFAVLQGARGSTAAVLKEKLLALGSSGILAEHQLQAQLQEQHLKGQSKLTTISALHPMRGRKNPILDDSRGALRALPAVGRSLLPIARKDGLNQTQFVNNNNPNSTPLLQFRQCLSARQTWSNGVRQPTAFASVILTNSCSPCLLASYNSVLSCQHATQVLSEAYVAPGAKISVFTTMIRLVKFGYRRLPSDTARHCFLYSSTAYSPQTMKQSLSKT